MSAHEDWVEHNAKYVAAFGDKKDLPLPPAKKLAIGELIVSALGLKLTCNRSLVHGRTHQVRLTVQACIQLLTSGAACTQNSVSTKATRILSAMPVGARMYSPAVSLSCVDLFYHRKDALRSLIISQRLLGTRKIAVFHHTDCGMLTFTSSQLRSIVKDSDPGNKALEAVDSIDFLEFPELETSVKDDVEYLRSNPLLLPETTVSGWVYDVTSGKVSLLQ